MKTPTREELIKMAEDYFTSYYEDMIDNRNPSEVLTDFALQVLRDFRTAEPVGNSDKPQDELSDFMKEPLDAAIKRKAELYNSPQIDAIISDITLEQIEETRRRMMGETFTVRALWKRGTDKWYFGSTLITSKKSCYIEVDRPIAHHLFEHDIYPDDCEIVELECRVTKIIEL